jgi:hypothetical protein
MLEGKYVDVNKLDVVRTGCIDPTCFDTRYVWPLVDAAMPTLHCIAMFKPVLPLITARAADASCAVRGGTPPKGDVA